MATWTTDTFSGIMPGNTVELDGKIGQVVTKGSDKDGLFIFLRGLGPFKVTSDEQIEVFR